MIWVWLGLFVSVVGVISTVRRRRRQRQAMAALWASLARSQNVVRLLRDYPTDWPCALQTMLRGWDSELALLPPNDYRLVLSDLYRDICRHLEREGESAEAWRHDVWRKAHRIVSNLAPLYAKTLAAVDPGGRWGRLPRIEQLEKAIRLAIGEGPDMGKTEVDAGR